MSELVALVLTGRGGKYFEDILPTEKMTDEIAREKKAMKDIQQTVGHEKLRFMIKGEYLEIE